MLEEFVDPVLDRVLRPVPGSRERGPGRWVLVRNRRVFPPAWAARSVHEATNWGNLYAALSAVDEFEVAWFVAGDGLSALPAPAANKAIVKSWDGQTAVVEHDGACVLIMRRAFYPGWFYRLNGGPLKPVLKVEGGLQGESSPAQAPVASWLLTIPPASSAAAKISLTALAAAALVLCTAAGQRVTRYRSLVKHPASA